MFPGLAPCLGATNDLLTRRVTRFPKERALSLPEYLSFPGLQDQVVWASEDATTKVIGAIDWDAGVAVVEPVKDLWEPLQTLLRDSLRPSLDPHKDGPEGCFTRGPILPAKEGEGEVMISLAELLALVSARWKQWVGNVVVYAGHNQNVIRWIASREAGPAAARFLLQVLGAAEAAGHFRFFAEYIRTYHNVAADDLTRRPAEEVLRENRLERPPAWRLFCMRRGVGWLLQGRDSQADEDLLVDFLLHTAESLL